MNCNTCRFELSQCLDGRLPSGRRAVVMRHAEACRSCHEFWTELQAAQRLALRLSPARVGDDFREGLWDRIRSGEGTPDAVFREPVPVLTKVRYALTGAAAAAAVLLAALHLRSDRERPLDEAMVAAGAPAAGTPMTGPTAAEREYGLRRRTPETVFVSDSPLISATRPLTFNLVAVETARQLEQRHAAVTHALRRIDDPRGRDVAVEQAIENADEFRAFAELLLDLRDRQRLFFTDARVDADLRFAVNMLAQRPLGDGASQPDLRTVRTIVAPALRSDRLADVSRTITLVPESDPQDELEALLRLNRLRPEVFPKLFFVLGRADDASALQMLPGMTFFMEDACGPSWVAPRSEVESRDAFLRMLSRQTGDSGRVELRIEIHSHERR